MGKGSRTRALHTQNSVVSPYKAKKKKAQIPQWILPAFIILVMAAVLFVAISSAISNSGIIQRSRIIIKSQSGKYDVSQQVATFVAWQELYTTYYYYYQYLSESESSSNSSTTSQYTADEYALSLAQYSIEQTPRDCIEDVLDNLLNYVAVCDKALAEGMTLDEADKAEVEESLDALKTIQKDMGYSSFNAFLRAVVNDGMKEKDVRKAMEMAVLYNKYRTQLEGNYEKALTLADLEAFRNTHPEDYYKTDYLTFAADNKELADQLKACTTKQEFLDAIVKHHFDTNYKSLFTRLVASNDYKTIENKTNNNGGTELTDALNTLGADELATFTPDSLDDTKQAQLEKWLFDTSRKQYATGLVTETEGVYIVAFLSESASTSSVQARIKFYAFADAPDAFDNDDSFKAALLETLMAEKRADLLFADMQKDNANIDALLAANNAIEVTGVTADSTDVPKAVITQAVGLANKAGSINQGYGDGVHYVVYLRSTNDSLTSADIAYVAFGTPVTLHHSASQKSDALTEKLSASGADINAIMTENGATEKTGISETGSDVPSAVTKKIFATGSTAGSVYTTNASGVYYVIYLKTLANGKADFSYISYENDNFYTLVSDMQDILEKDNAYPTDKSAKYAPTAEAGTFEAWISQVKEGTVESLLKEHDTTVIETTKDNVTTYNVYMVINTPMYLDTFKVVDGAYLMFSGNDHAAKANEALTRLQGKTGDALTAELTAISANTTVSHEISKGSLADEKVADWMFSTDRKANDFTVITKDSGTNTYIAIYLDSMMSWQASAKENYLKEKTDESVAALTSAYKVNEKALKQIGETSTTATSATTTAATTAA